MIFLIVHLQIGHALRSDRFLCNFVAKYSNLPCISHDKNKMPKRAFNFCGGDEGIRTLDTLASIPHFQCGALDQLCDVSELCGFNYSSLSDASGVSSSATGSPFSASSIKEFSNSASISRNIGSSLAISNEASSSIAVGASL